MENVMGAKTGIFIVALVLMAQFVSASGIVIEEIKQNGMTSLMSVDSGDFIVAGGISNGTGLGDFDAVVYRFNSSGSLVWAKAYGSQGRDLLTTVKVINGNRILAAGGSSYFGGGWIFELDGDGNVLWSRSYNTEIITSVIPYGDGFLAASSKLGHGIILKLSSNGSPLSGYMFDFNYSVVPVKLEALPDGSIFVAGMIHSPATNSQDMWLAEISNNGTVIWQRSFGGNGTEQLYDMEVDGKGITLVGYTTSPSLGVKNNVDLLVIRTDLQGNLLWAKRVGSPQNDWANAVTLLPTGELLVGGITYAIPSLSAQAWLLVLDSAGNVERWITFGGKGSDWIRGMVTLPDGRVILVGGTNGKTNGLGQLLSSNPLFIMLNGTTFHFEGCNLNVKRPLFTVSSVSPVVWTGPAGPLMKVRIASAPVEPEVKALSPSVSVLCPQRSSSSPITSPTTHTPTTPSTTSSLKPSEGTQSSTSNSASPSSSKGVSSSGHEGSHGICGPAFLLLPTLIAAMLMAKKGK
ncbi:PQQ-like beta-propeller repeat protein [Thermococcus sp. Bubb.Bath]|uniref:PQQ-like beta-propeller repeat protein n=1 Tax=Thermococcus sp. Bubb.Bath TaxID=1638242 RepID=UPI0014388446|nr:PQQ-like beta-propeller repeat protein [Thermococcus sp. Bubb.Bath]NJF24563.1 amylopullulanase [Thermococcus sp. Bubb.Bath]